jgi:hypothetical protein
VQLFLLGLAIFGFVVWLARQVASKTSAPPAAPRLLTERSAMLKPPPEDPPNLGRSDTHRPMPETSAVQWSWEISPDVPFVEAEAAGSATTPARFASRGSEISLFGYELKDGMFYIGSGLTAVSNAYTPEPALIDPSQPIDLRNPDDAGRTMSYWPSYSTIEPEARAAYLRWLAAGRRDPDAYIGFVFLYFYGLERRSLYDVISDPDARTDLPEIRRELERLLSIYSTSRSFRRYATSLLDFLRVRDGQLTTPGDEPPQVVRGDGLSLLLRVGIAQFAKAGLPLPARWALAWMRCDPQANLRTPATRCATEFDRLFIARYGELHGDGIKLRDCKARIRMEHNPASASFSRRAWTFNLDLPDVCGLTGPQNALRELAQRCCDELDGLSRFLSRSPTERDSMAAVALLPAPLLAGEPSGATRRILSVVEPALAADMPVLVPTSALIDSWTDGPPQERLAKRDAVLLAQFLQHMHIVI